MFGLFPLIAFGFGSPLMLWGLAAGSIPILIHLLHRRRYQTVPWAAMRFLLAATKKQSRRLKLEQLLLLLVRTMIVVCLALALARPTAETLGQYFQSEGPKHRIIVIDATLSMGSATTGRTRFDRARELARQIVAGSRQGDAINLVRISESTPHVIIARPAYQSMAVIEEIEQLLLYDERVDASIVLKEVQDLLSLAPEIRRKEVYLITDLQASTWAPANSVEASRIRETLKTIGSRSQVVWLDVGDSNASNTAVTGLRIDNDFVLSGRPVRVSASLKNFSSIGASNQLVELMVDGQLTDTKRADLPAGQEVSVDFSPTFSDGEHRLNVRIAPDTLPVDDVRSLVIPVRSELQVLLINGKPSGEPMGNSTDFLKLALAPELPNRAFSSPMRPTVIRESELLGSDLSRYDCVFACNIAMFTEREAEVLRSYLESGGGVVFCLGDQVRPDNYNQILHAEKQPILPARLIERTGDPRKKDVAFTFDPGEFNHPILQPFAGNANAGLELTKTFVYVKAEVDADRGAEVALGFSSGDPAIVDAPYGRGRVVLVTTSVDREWSTWAVWGHSLIPLMHETVNYAVSGRWKDRDVLVGQPLQCHVGLRATDTPAVLHLPNGDTKQLQPSADGRNITSEPTATSGFHKIVLGPPANRTDWFAVNVDTQESDLTSLQSEDLRTELMPGIEFRYLTEWEEAAASNGEQVRVISTGTGFSRSLLFAAMALLLVEQLMAWNFVAGASLLLAFAMGSLTLNAYRWDSWIGAGLASVIAISLVALALKFRPVLRSG
ncbi:BatA domain-containing protein [Schlesneria sp. DSM 10557]|uniref:BatA domain-containing protein n=1 Tax=Schlesneria sp. DSM 10557 TaxID=3044399 RepID=UPI0035A105B1